MYNQSKIKKNNKPDCKPDWVEKRKEVEVGEMMNLCDVCGSVMRLSFSGWTW